MPDERESLGEAGSRVCEQHPVGDMDDPTRRLIGVDPIADLQETEAEQADVDDIARMRSDLDTVASLERTSQHEIDPAGEILDHVRQSNGNTGRDDADD